MTDTEARRPAAARHHDGTAPQVEAPALVVRRRGAEIESVHRGWMVLVDGGAVRSAGDPETPVFSRSCTKPFQALAFLLSGAADRFGCGADELALACSSHDGTPEQRAIVSRMLARAGLTEASLQCGAAEPLGDEARKRFAAGGERPGPLTHNCSGKHAAFLLTQAHFGDDPARYLRADSPAQTLARRLTGLALDVPPGELGDFVDGCSAPTFRVPLRALAVGFARLASPETAPAEIRDGLARVRDAIVGHPISYAGPRRLCTALLRASQGAVIPKNGAEGVYAFGVRGRRLGFAVKVEDGASRGYRAAVLAAVRGHAGLSDAALEELRSFADPELHNAAGLAVGREELVQTL